jgi:hypothetical protein
MAKAIAELTAKQFETAFAKARREWGRTGSMASLIRFEEFEAEAKRRAERVTA